ncbi:unnamed protein product [Chondrus crispus]|uniref:Uncharacterized protein n=1 Tax=Chondrus crispus TaxID=2769 RepID=R7QPD2_CHOCR|nr:unnamed protein product [Chondrus crispus]CDF39250.1 unnamed protein product [Chondrus crispus]|eukprot:XP_005719161.1 unnamed protein product [Chondrus crispus]
MASLVAEAHGVERIEALTTHVSLDVRTRARLLLERMFGAEPTTADLSPPLPPPAVTGLSSLSSPPPPPPLGHAGCSCSYQHQHHAGLGAYHAGLYDVSGNLNPHASLTAAAHVGHGVGVEQGLPGHLHADGELVEVQGSTSGSSSDSDPDDDDSDADLIPPPPAPCSCVLCSDPSPLAERRPRGRSSFDDSDFSRKGASADARGLSEIRQICNFCSGEGRLGDGRAGLAAKLGRAVRLGHPHCIAILLSRMTWSQRAAATEAPALLHPGGGPPDGGVGSSLPAVILAAQLGKPECLGLLLRRCKPDLDVTHGKKRLTALAWAAHKGYMRCCQLLIEYGAKPSTKCGDGVTALHLAASGGGHIAICKLLIDRKAPVSARSAKKQTPLCLAAQKGFAKVVQMLLEHGADPNNEDEGKYTPLHLSASNGFVPCVELLLQAGARVDSTTRKGVTPLHYAVQGAHADAVKLLIAAGAKVNCTRKPLLLIAADDGNLEVVQILLDAYATIDCKANIKATLDKDLEVYDYLTPLHLSASKGHHEVVDLLLTRGAFVNEVTSKSGWSALDFAVLNGHAECAVTLLNHGATVTDNCKGIGRNNWTLVQYAAHHQAKDVVRLLIQRLKEQRMNASTISTHIGEPNTAATSATGVSQGVVDRSDISAPNGSTIPLPLEEKERLSYHFPGDAEIDDSSYFATDEHGSFQHHYHHHYHHSDRVADVNTGYHRYDPRSAEGDESAFPASRAENSAGPQDRAGGSRRRVVKEDRQSTLRRREIKKREAEATDARDRLEEAISQRSVSKLTEAIAHVSKLVLHLATSVGGDISAGGHLDHSDMNGYGSHVDAYGHVGHVHSPGGSHSKQVAGTASSVVSAPLAMEVGLGNEVQKARKILAGLLAEEKRMREEKEREVADTKRDNTQQTVKKAITAALQGGDPRSLGRVTNRATRTVLDKANPVVVESIAVSSLISNLEKWESHMKVATSKKNLDGLAEALPEVSGLVSELKKRGGDGAATRVFGGSDPAKSLESANQLLDDLKSKRENELAKEAEARAKEKAAQGRLAKAIESDDIVELEKALDVANSALLTKQSELATTIESGKKVMTKWLKMERRKLRQASNSGDPAIIEKAAAMAESFGLQALGSEIETAKKLAGKLRKQAEAVQILQDATAQADVSALTAIRKQLTTLGMFAEAEQARAEVERLQRATRARTLLEGAIEETKKCREQFSQVSSQDENTPAEDVELRSSWTWPDVQRLGDLSDRARKYGQPMKSLCDNADQLATEIAALGRQVLALTTRSNDARGIAAVIAGYENSFVNVARSDLFNVPAGEKALRDARQRLHEVQAMDQASVKAESAQVKVEYALATSRRSAARHRGGKGPKSQAQAQSTHGNGSYPVLQPTTANGRPSIEQDTFSPSSLSSEFAEDDEGDTDSSLPPLDGSEEASTRSLDGHPKGAVSRKPRGVGQGDDAALLDSLVDMSVSSSECSHFYLFKEGTTVCCARCGHLRNSGNPNWLARVKERDNKLPPELGNVALPSYGSAPDLYSAFSAIGAQLNGQVRPSPAVTGSQPVSERGIQRPGYLNVSKASTKKTIHPTGAVSSGQDPTRSISGAGGRTSPHPASVNMMAQLIQQHQLQQQQHYHQSQQQRSHGRQPPAQVRQSQQPQLRPQQTPGHMASSLPQAQSHQVSKNSQAHRSRGRPQAGHVNASVEDTAGLTAMYAGALGAGRGVGGAQNAMGMASKYTPTSNLQNVAPVMKATPQGPMHGYGMAVSRALPVIHPKAGHSVRNDLGVVSGVNQSGLGMEVPDANHHAGRGSNGMSSRMPSSRAVAAEEIGGPGLDLGLDFANENFGFDIGAIVDEIPPPNSSEAGVGSQDLGRPSEHNSMYTSTSHAQANGFYQR